MTRHTHDPMAREADQLADQDRQERAAVAQAAADWRAKWPNHCTECDGWGCTTTAAGQEPCDAKHRGICHRCGGPGMSDPWGDPLEMCWQCLWKPGEDGVPR